MPEVKQQFMNRGAGSDPLIGQLESTINEMKKTFDEIQDTLETYDEKLINVLGQH